ncbi:MAG: hypothetical protein ACM3ML_14875, partial [Micromonosporaceae bacterium]
RRPVTGTPQGGPLSPLMCNVYLHRLDRAWDGHDGVLVRFADLCRGRHKSAYAEERVMPTLAAGVLPGGQAAVSWSA